MYYLPDGNTQLRRQKEHEWLVETSPQTYFRIRLDPSCNLTDTAVDFYRAQAALAAPFLPYTGKRGRI